MGRATGLVLGILVVGLLGVVVWLLNEADDATRADVIDPVSPASSRELDLRPDRERAALDVPALEQEIQPLAPSASQVQPAPAWHPDDPAGLLLYGAIFDPDGLPLDVSQHWVGWQLPDGTRRNIPTKGSTYAMAGLKPGPGELIFSKQGFLPYAQAIELDPAVVARRADIHLQAARSLCVRVELPSGQPLLESLPREQRGLLHYGVLASPDAQGPSLPPIGHRMHGGNAHSTWISSFETWGDRKVEVGCNGMLDLHSPLPLWVHLLHRSEVLASQRVEEDATEVVFVLSMEQALAAQGSVRGRLVDAVTDAPVTDAYVGVSDSQTGGPRAELDAEGAFTQDGLAPGIMDLNVFASGYEHLRDTILIEAGQETDLGTIALSPPTSISGTVVDQEGQPASVNLSCAPAQWHHTDYGQLPRVSYESDTDGSFVMKRLGRRPYIVWARGPSGDVGSATLRVDTSAGDVEGVVVQLEPLVAVTLRAPWPEDQQHVVTLVDANGHSNGRYAMSGGKTWKRSCVPGEYFVTVAGARSETSLHVRSEPVEVTLPAP